MSGLQVLLTLRHQTFSYSLIQSVNIFLSHLEYFIHASPLHRLGEIHFTNSCVFLFALFSKVVVENDCTVISPSQKVQVTVKTVPNYCGITWTGTYEAPSKNTVHL